MSCVNTSLIRDAKVLINRCTLGRQANKKCHVSHTKVERNDRVREFTIPLRHAGKEGRKTGVPSSGCFPCASAGRRNCRGMGFHRLDVSDHQWATHRLSGMSEQARRYSRRGAALAAGDQVRPPWTSEASVLKGCTSCGSCIEACPESILRPGPGRTPVVDFTGGECTFCAACADACPEPVFAETGTRPWTLTANIDAGCMLTSGISCQLCTDHCEAEALRLDLSHRPVGRIAVNTASCTGCGACLSACPISAISLSDTQPEAVHV